MGPWYDDAKVPWQHASMPPDSFRFHEHCLDCLLDLLKLSKIRIDSIVFDTETSQAQHLPVTIHATGDLSEVSSRRVGLTYEQIEFEFQSDSKF